MARNIQVVFQTREVNRAATEFRDGVHAVAGVWLDLDLLDELIVRAANNKGRKAHDGCVFVEIHLRSFMAKQHRLEGEN